ncbi:Putative heat shock protein YegD [Minicystis rosea]|nr:Putative heat shock protein YegD [Minicystis rosea]
MENADLPTVYALDFGTSNSLLAAANADHTFSPAPIDPRATDPIILRSVLYFPNAQRCYYGEEALRRYAENGLDGRLLRSIKKHLPSRSFHGTYIDERPMPIEDLVAAVIREMRIRANTYYCTEVDRVVLGRPARFAEEPLDDQLAQRRLEEAARRAGFNEVVFLPEPIAAAREFGVGVGEERVVLVADFGGGTSDFTVMRVGPRNFRPSDVLAIGGVAVAGDALDASIMRSQVARHFGAEVSYKVPLGSNVLTMPKPIVEHLCSPANLSILRRADVAEFLRNVRKWSVGPDDREKLDQLSTLVDDGLGFSIFEVIEQAKRTLSGADEASIDFSYPSIDVHERVTRTAFETASERATSTILRCLDETLAAAGVAPSEVQDVCCTGGTAKVPRIAAEIRRRFGDARVRDYKSFTSVVEGLAVHARSLARGELDVN